MQGWAFRTLAFHPDPLAIRLEFAVYGCGFLGDDMDNSEACVGSGMRTIINGGFRPKAASGITPKTPGMV